MDSQAKRRRTLRTPEKVMDAFIDGLGRGLSVQGACSEAGLPKRTAYDLRQADEAFALRWADAVESGTDELVDVARTRAVAGSDVLLMFLIKARRPEYRERYTVDQTVKHVVPRSEAEMLQRIAANDPELASRLARAAAELEA